jgi:hypothetical protein
LILDGLPAGLNWFGRPGSMATITIVVTVCVMTFRSDVSHRLVGVSSTVIAVLFTFSAVLGLAAYWKCHDANHPAVVTPLMWTAQLIKGSIGDTSLSGRTCPNPTPVGLELARIASLSAIFMSLRHDVTYRTRSEIDNVLNAIETRDNPDAKAEVPAVEKPAPPAAAVQTATATAVSTPPAGGGGGANKSGCC